MAHGLLVALATAHRRGIINVDLRDGHMYFDRSDGSYRLIDWDCSITIAAAAGRNPAAPRDSNRSCAIDQPAVPVHFWEEILSNRPPTIAPESLFSWRDGSVHGCRFSPAVDIWHAALIVAKELGCNIDLKPQLLRHAGQRQLQLGLSLSAS